MTFLILDWRGIDHLNCLSKLWIKKSPAYLTSFLCLNDLFHKIPLSIMLNPDWFDWNSQSLSWCCAGSIAIKCPYSPALQWQSNQEFQCNVSSCQSAAVMAEWLRRWTRNPMGYSRTGSNPVHSVSLIFFTFKKSLWLVMMGHENLCQGINSCDGRVVKALDSKSNGIFPHRFEPCSQRDPDFFYL